MIRKRVRFHKICSDCRAEIIKYNSNRCRVCNAYARVTPEYRLKQRLSHIGKPHPWNLGKKRPTHSKQMKNLWKDKERREKARIRGLQLIQDPEYMSKLSKASSGSNNANWCGGLSMKGYKGFYKSLKKKIRHRDNYTCQLCGRTELELGYTLSVNHINYNKEDNREENLNSLCKSCNSKINFEREKWSKYFNERMLTQLVLAK